eukprot:g41328.t1
MEAHVTEPSPAFAAALARAAHVMANRRYRSHRTQRFAEAPYVDLTGVFTAAKWRRTATKALLKATDAVDQLCHTLVLIKHAFPRGEVAIEVRKLALTLATFERAIFWYAVRIRKFRLERAKRRQRTPRPGEPRRSPPPTTCQSLRPREERRGRTSSATSDYSDLDYAPTPEQLLDRHAQHHHGAHGLPSIQQLLNDQQPATPTGIFLSEEGTQGSPVPVVRHGLYRGLSGVSGESAAASPLMGPAMPPPHDLLSPTPRTASTRLPPDLLSPTARTAARPPHELLSPTARSTVPPQQGELDVDLPSVREASNSSAMSHTSAVASTPRTTTSPPSSEVSSNNSAEMPALAPTASFHPHSLLPAPTAHPTGSAYLAQNEHRIFKHAGGIVSLLKLLTLTLSQTRRLLGRLYQEHLSMRKWYWARKTWLLGMVPPLLLLRLPLRSFTKKVLELLLLPIFPRLGPAIKQWAAKSFLMRWAFLALVPLTFQAIFYRSLYEKMNNLRMLRSRLGILLRLWYLSISILDDQAEGKGDRARANQAGQNLAQWMLEQCPPNLDSAFWYSVSSQLQLLKCGWDVVYCATYDWHHLAGTNNAWGLPIFLVMAPYYALRRKHAARKHSDIMGCPDITLVKQVWGIFETPLFRKVRDLVPQWRPKAGVACREFKIRYASSPPANAAIMEDGDGSQERLDRYTRSVKVMLVSSEPLDIAVNDRFSAPRRAGNAKQKSKKHLHPPVPVILYFHGGGFISNFRTANMALLSSWATATGFPILYFDYSLSPENAYPVALDECFDVYNWLCEGRLGLEPSKIIFIGESVGGNLATATVMRAISSETLRIPDALILACPILNLGTEQTPSRSLFMMDAVLPLNLLNQCRSVYVPSNCDANSDPCLSPLVAHPHLLQQFPPTSIMVGELDPFLDDSVDMAHRLYYSAVFTRLKIYPTLPHSFFSFVPWLSRAAAAVDQLAPPHNVQLNFYCSPVPFKFGVQLRILF